MPATAQTADTPLNQNPVNLTQDETGNPAGAPNASAYQMTFAGEQQYKNSVDRYNLANPTTQVKYTPRASYNTQAQVTTDNGISSVNGNQFINPENAQQYAQTYGQTADLNPKTLTTPGQSTANQTQPVDATQNPAASPVVPQMDPSTKPSEPPQAIQPNLNTQPPQGGFQYQSTAGNIVPKTTGDDGLLSATNQKTGQIEQVSPNDPRWNSGTLIQNNPSYQTGQTDPSQNTRDTLQSLSGMSFDSLFNHAMDQGSDKTGADLLRASLQAQLGAIDDPTVHQYLDNMSNRAQQAYAIGLNLVQTGKNEVAQAANGTLVAPTTIEGVQAKIYKDSQEYQTQNLQAQQEYIKVQNDAQLDKLRQSRADLEGYLKASMFASGAQDSSAALSVMSQSIHSADLNITLQNASNTYNQTQLNLKGMQVMSDYANNVNGLAAELTQKQMQTTSDYYTQLSKIDEEAFTNEKEKRQLTSNTLGDYNKSMMELRNNTLNRNLEYQRFAWEKTTGLVDISSKLSGMTGSVYMPDGKGGVVNTGMPSLQMYQFGKTYDLDKAKFNLSATSERRAAVNDAFSLFKDTWNGDMANSFEQALGLSQGELQGKSWNEAQDYVNVKADASDQALQLMNAPTSQMTSSAPQPLKDALGLGQAQGWCGVYASTLSTASPVGNTWNEKMTHIDHTDNPQPGDKLLLPLSVGTDGKGMGHVATVLKFNSNTGDMLVAESNADGRQSRDHNNLGVATLGKYNLYDLQQKYDGSSADKTFGFASGQLKPNIQAALDESFQPQPQSQSGLPIDFNKISAGTATTIPKPIQENFNSSGLPDQFGKDPTVSEYKDLQPKFNTLQGVAAEMKTTKDRQAVDDSLIDIFQRMINPNGVVQSWSSNVVDDNVPLASKAAGILQKITAGGKNWTDVDRKHYIDLANKIYATAQQSYTAKRNDYVTRSVGAVPGLTKPMAENYFEAPSGLMGLQGTQGTTQTTTSQKTPQAVTDIKSVQWPTAKQAGKKEGMNAVGVISNGQPKIIYIPFDQMHTFSKENQGQFTLLD